MYFDLQIYWVKCCIENTGVSLLVCYNLRLRKSEKCSVSRSSDCQHLANGNRNEWLERKQQSFPKDRTDHGYLSIRQGGRRIQQSHHGHWRTAVCQNYI